MRSQPAAALLIGLALLAGCGSAGHVVTPTTAPSAPATPGPVATTETSGVLRVVHSIECCYVEGAFAGLRITSSAGRVVLERERQPKAWTAELAKTTLPAGRYRVETWERPCDGNCSNLDPPTERCSIDATVGAAATTEVRVRVLPGAGCRADIPPTGSLPPWPTTLVEIDETSGAITTETPLDLSLPTIIGTDGTRPVFLVDVEGHRRIAVDPTLDVWTATAADGLVALDEQPSGRLVVLDVRGGRRWDRPGDAQGYAPIIGSGLVLEIDRDGTVHALDAGDGHERWSVAGPFQFVEPAGTDVILGGGWETTSWRVVDATTGRERSRASLPTGDVFGSDPVEVAGRLIGSITNRDGASRIEAADVATGTIAWQSADLYADQLVAAGSLVVVAGRGRLVALDARTGATRWQLDGSWAIDRRLTDPAFAEGHVFALRH